MWPRVRGMRSMEMGTPGAMRAELTKLVLDGRKTATTGLLDDYREEAEGLEYPGEKLALLDDGGEMVGVLTISHVEVRSFGDVAWEHAKAEGEGDSSIEEWREGHVRYWGRLGKQVDDETPVVCLRFTAQRLSLSS
jgi:uncharacterized protein YhfF